MKRFVVRILLFFGIPVMLLMVLFLVSDPFKTMRPFNFHYYDESMRDYCTSEVYLRNDSIYHFNSFVFGSSRGMGINTYHWKQYLPSGSRQFLFQAWAENLDGVEQKVDYIDRNGDSINNALVLLDIPGSFSKIQLSKSVTYIKHYRFSGQSKFAFHACLFFGFLQKPSKWFSSIRQTICPTPCEYHSDTISNDWESYYRFLDNSQQPQKDSLSLWSRKNKIAYLKQIEGKTDADLRVSDPVITDDYKAMLKHIKSIFDKHRTDYRIVVTPAYCYMHASINPLDLSVLREIFGTDRVFDYSGKNEITSDCYNFSDADHFGQSVGWQIIEEIYHK